MKTPKPQQRTPAQTRGTQQTVALTPQQQDRYQRLRFRVQRALRRLANDSSQAPKQTGKRIGRRIGQRRNRWLKKYGSRAAELIAVVPDIFHLMCKLTVDPRVPVKEKAKLGFAIAYFVSPIDLIPATLTGPIGFVDDLAIAAYVLNSLLNKIDADIVREHWAGEQDILEVLQDITHWADSFFSTSIFDKLRGWIDNKPELPRGKANPVVIDAETNNQKR